MSKALAAGVGGLALLCGMAATPLRADEPPPSATPPAAPRPAERQPPATQQPTRPPGMTLRAGSFPRSFLIPGTDTSLSIGGH